MTATEEKLTVVLVEDDERLAQLTAKYLETHNVTVAIVNDGRDAVGRVMQVRPDVVLLDLMLPGLSGLDICRELRQRSDVPIVMVTARGEEADRVVGLEGGADDYIAKPFSSRELLARIRAHARRARGAVGPRHAREGGRSDAARDHHQPARIDLRVVAQQIVAHRVGDADHPLAARHDRAVA